MAQRAYSGTRCRRAGPTAIFVFGLLGLSGCDPESEDVGKPCERKSDCAGTLICDLHEGGGSCQAQHTHDDGGTGDDANADDVGVRWIDVAASNYKLDLVPDFDPTVDQYTAQADGPGIEVYFDVLLDGDADGVLVNGTESIPMGYRTWRSPDDADLVAPVPVTIEVLDGDTTTSIYDVEITVP